MSKNIYIVYETTNLINGKYYIGVHNLSRVDYLGSGKLLKLAIKKYGRSNFIRETIKEFHNEKDAYDYENFIVDDKMVYNRNCYNITIGGGIPPTLKGKDHPFYNKTRSKEHCKRISESKIGVYSGKNNPMYGRKGKLSPLWGKRYTQEESKAHSIKITNLYKNGFNPRGIGCYIFGKYFKSYREAGRVIGVYHKTITSWCNNNIPHCYSISKEGKL